MIRAKSNTAPPTAVVLNMYYTGLGLARSLGERGVPVIGLTSKRGVYGNFTRYAKVLVAPDSRQEPEQLKKFLIDLARTLGNRAVIFPTRDDDLVFLDRFRTELAAHYSIVAPDASALSVCLDKWETYCAARKEDISAPRCWLVSGPVDAARVSQEVNYPCVMKPLAAHHWRQGENWAIVGARKAFSVESEKEFLREYRAVANADERVLVQEMVDGPDDALVIAACYVDKDGKWVAGFNTRKLLQVPAGFGTGCIVEVTDRPELLELSRRLLEAIGFSGVAEVEFKWDAGSQEYKLIEINPRPWDQHRLGNACNVDLMYLAYCDYAGLPLTVSAPRVRNQKWIAEDTFFTTVLRSLWKHDRLWRSMFRMASGDRIYAIWEPKDPVPFLWYVLSDLPQLCWSAGRYLLGQMRFRMLSQRGAIRRMT